MRDHKSYQLWENVAPQSVTSSTDATPIVVTKASHGYSTGNTVSIFGHTTNVAANGIFKITVVDADTFSLQNVQTGANVAGSGGGAGSGGVMISGLKYINVQDFQHVVLGFATSGTATTTVKVFGSMGVPTTSIPLGGNSVPNFGGTQSQTNPYAALQIVDLDTGAAVNGATGIVVAGADVNKNYEVNTNGLMWLCLIPVSWTQGSITARLSLYDNE